LHLLAALITDVEVTFKDYSIGVVNYSVRISSQVGIRQMKSFVRVIGQQSFS
jgi:hypothetical protein